MMNEITPNKNNETQEKKFSSGVFMTVWQSVPHRPEVQMLMRQQHEIEQLKIRFEAQDARLKKLEEGLEEIKHFHTLYQSFVSTLNTILGEQK